MYNSFHKSLSQKVWHGFATRGNHRLKTGAPGINGIGSKALTLVRSEDGPTATEYAVLLGVISIGVLSAMSAFGIHMDNIYATLTGSVNVF